jgi:hypothetical protein
MGMLLRLFKNFVSISVSVVNNRRVAERCSVNAEFFLICLVVLIVPLSASAQHLTDPEFKPTVERPAYPKNAPRVLFDEAHFNLHTSTNRYGPFTELSMNDGYRIVINRQPFTKKSLDTFKIVIIVNALGEDIDETEANDAAFTAEECVALRDWVKDGGSLLFIADAGPSAKSATEFAKYFGVEMSNTVAVDAKKSSSIEYSRENGLLGEHSIMQGRDAAEKIQRVRVFTGQTLTGPADSVVLLKAPDPGPVDAKKSASGQGLAFKFGGGRVVALGDAEMLTALMSEPPENSPIGMNYPGVDNKQLTLNIMHWLSGLIR